MTFLDGEEVSVFIEDALDAEEAARDAYGPEIEIVSISEGDTSDD